MGNTHIMKHQGPLLQTRFIYRKTSSISRTKSQSLNVSCILAQLSSLNPLKPAVELRMKMLLEQRRQAMLQLHLSYQQFIAYRGATYIRGFTVISRHGWVITLMVYVGCNYSYILQRRFDKIVVEVWTWMNNYIPLFYFGVIIHPYPNPDAGFIKLY